CDKAVGWWEAVVIPLTGAWRAGDHAATRVSSAIISSNLSRSGTSGVSLTIRTWHITGARSGNTRELSGRTTSELTLTNCGNPCDTIAKFPPSNRVPKQWNTTTR